MSLVIPPGYASAAFIFTGAQGTQPYVTTIGVSLAQAGGDFVVAANTCFLAYQAKLLPETSNQLTLDRVTLSIGADGPSGSVDSTIAPSPGLKSGNFPPTACSLIARKTTNELGRRGRGRMFVPGVLSETDVDQDGTVIASRRTALNTALLDFMGALEAGTGGVEVPPVLLHGPGAGAIPPTPIVGLTCSDLVGWVRGRIR